MKRLLFSITMGLVAVAVAQAQSADDIIGKYRLPNHLDVEIFKVESKYYGEIIGLGEVGNGVIKDTNNPDKSLHGDPLLGKIIIKNLVYDLSTKQWVGGSMYSPEKGLVFNLKVTEVRESEIEIIGSKFFFWKTLTWKKIL